jgi:NAD(P)-dependent dehydrogenase (short-subunit alcohol dehydrogenase family)
MAESAAHLVDHVIPRVPIRQWVLSFPIPLRILFAAHPELLAPVLRIVHDVIARFAVFLASDESRMLTGTTIAADGGRSSYLKVYAGDDEA